MIKILLIFSIFKIVRVNWGFTITIPERISISDRKIVPRGGAQIFMLPIAKF